MSLLVMLGATIALSIFSSGISSSLPGTKKTQYDLNLAEEHFNQFIQLYNKEYKDDTERAKRFQIFKKQLEEINQMNRDEEEHAEFGINYFTDITREEFLQRFSCTNMRNATPCTQHAPLNYQRAPEQFDWRDKNKVTRVKDQGNCGSCWTFSTTGTLEGQYAIKHNELKEFSEQQLVDCDNTSDGCGGGFMSNALLYLKANGAVLEEDYPYIAQQGSRCLLDKSKVAAKVLECYQHNPKTEDDLVQALLQYGPLAIAISANLKFHRYTHGILTNCPADNNIDHGVLLVGYGTENGIPYWTIKNSWGLKWGENGYIRVLRNVNSCNLMNRFTVSPKVE